MKTKSRRCTGTCRLLIALLGLASWSGPAGAEDLAAATPLNARMKSYGGWECDRGYRKVGESCALLEVPPDAHLDSFGHAWRCNRGYQKANEACVKIEVPPHAYLRSRGIDWECDRGYRKVDRSCTTVAIPENAYLDYSGGRWQCERGFRESGDSCVALEVPQEAVRSRLPQAR
jgi:hypothetical protein